MERIYQRFYTLIRNSRRNKQCKVMDESERRQAVCKISNASGVFNIYARLHRQPPVRCNTRFNTQTRRVFFLANGLQSNHARFIIAQRGWHSSSGTSICELRPAGCLISLARSSTGKHVISPRIFTFGETVTSVRRTAHFVRPAGFNLTAKTTLFKP